MDLLLRIKRLVFHGRVRFTEKARSEMETDDLSPTDVLESILNAQGIAKTMRSRSPARRHSAEKLYVLKSFDFGGTLIYTKGAIRHENARDVFYILVSAKITTTDE